jgi:hypothetical protein
MSRPQGKKYHSRTIEINTYEYDEQSLAVEGCLTDRRWQEYRLVTGEKKPPGILHQMIIHLLVNKTTRVIEDLQVDIPCAPREECRDTVNSLESIRGLKVTGGFTAKVKALAGNGKGCKHLAELLTAMGPAAIQGFVAYHLLQSTGFLANMINMLTNTCWTWRENGSLMDFLKEHGGVKNK